MATLPLPLKAADAGGGLVFAGLADPKLDCGYALDVRGCIVGTLIVMGDVHVPCKR
tara:strand:- start:333 stop:500 length:168 start_codon:yes stop_codon:yes gene_type:complete